VLIGKVFDDRFTVIAERGQLDALLLKSGDRGLQLNQLPFAVRSPIGGTKNQQRRSFRSPQSFKRLFMAKLVASGKVGRLLADLQPDRR
jgi:hypothetical protein